DAIARGAPHLLGVLLEELQVEPAPEAVDEEILEAALGAAWEELRPEIAEAEEKAAHRAELPGRIEVRLQGIVEELPVEINARHPVAHQHDVALGLARGRALVELAPFALVVESQRRLAAWPLGTLCRPGERQHAQPPVHHPAGLGEE